MASTPANNNTTGTAPVRLALIGLGRWGQVLARVIAAHPECDLVRVASTNPDARSLVSVPVDTDWTNTLADATLDGVVIATPPASHADIATAALDRGLAVFIEKPVTLNPAEADALLAHAQAKNAVAFVDHVHVFHPAYQALKAHIDPATITAIRTVNGGTGPDRDDASVLWDWGAHEAALVMDLLGTEPETLSTTARNGNDRDLDLRFTFAGGVTATSHIGTVMEKRCRLMAVATNNAVWVYDEHARSALVRLPADTDLNSLTPGITPDQATPVAAEETSPLDMALHDFAAAITKGGRNLGGLDLGVRVVKSLSRC